MKINLKKSMAISALLVTVLASGSPAFCMGEKVKLDSHHAMIIGKYFETKQDMTALVMAGKKFGSLGEIYRFNPTPYDPEFYPNIQTYVSYPEEKVHIDSFTYDISTLIYTAGSFDSDRYQKILYENKVNSKWEKTLCIDETTNKCNITFEWEDRKIVFYFDPFKSTNWDKTRTDFKIYEMFLQYNIFLNKCDIKYFVDMFKFKPNFKKIDIPKIATKIGFKCFNGCKFLKSVTIPNTVVEIGDAAFAGCSEIDEINIPSSVTSIGQFAFNGCKSLKSVIIPDSVAEIKDGAFFNCTSLKSIKISDSVTKIGMGVFMGTALNHIEYKNKVYNSVDEFRKGFMDLKLQNIK